MVFARHNRSLTNNRNRTALVFVRNFLEKELVGPFKLESTARVVSSPMSVLSAEQNPQVVNVPNRLHKTDPISVLKAHKEELKYRVLQSPPVSPVNMERLEILLHGYNPALTQYLIEGLS